MSHRQSLESLESASPLVTRAIAAGLQGQIVPGYNLGAFQRFGLMVLGWFPSGVARWLIPRVTSLTALDSKEVAGLEIGHLIRERLNDYAQLGGSFPVITMGAALGGATAHISLSMNSPFLPQAFVLTLKGGSPTGDAKVYFRRSVRLAKQIADQNPGVLTIQHFDPVHDGWLTRYVNHLRLKLLHLPDEYKDFIRRKLSPNGAICFLDCGARWMRYRISENSVFQVGGWGDITADEYLQGSQRLTEFCRAENLIQSNWQLTGYPLEEGPESEWGCEPVFMAAVARFCHEEGYRFLRISYDKPSDFSRLAYECIRSILEKDRREAAGVLIEMFSQFDSSSVMRAGLLPVWLVFNTNDSLEFLLELREQFPPEKPVFFSPLSTFTHTPDLVAWEKWERTLAGHSWMNIGTRRTHYPADPQTLTSWSNALVSWVKDHENPLRSRLNPDELAALARSLSRNLVL